MSYLQNRGALLIFLSFFCLGCDPIDRWDEDKVLPLVQGCYTFEGRNIFRITGRSIVQSERVFSDITGVGKGKSDDYLKVEFEILYDPEGQYLRHGRAIPNATIGYYDRDGEISIRLTSPKGEVYIFPRVDC